jgi:FMN reductase
MPSSESTLRLVVVTAGIGDPSSSRLLADQIAAAATTAVAATPGQLVDVSVIELREHATAVGQRLIQGLSTPALDTALTDVSSAHGLIAVTPVFNASYSGLFKSFFDSSEGNAMRGLPVVVAATGGTPRHSLVLEHAMRPLFAFVGADIMPTAVYAAAQDWGTLEEGHDSLPGRINRAGNELAARMIANSGVHTSGTTTNHQPDQPTSAHTRASSELIPFEQHLASLIGGNTLQ